MKRLNRRQIALLLVVGVVGWSGILAKPIAQIQDTPELPGTYICTGLNPEGKPYAGTVEIVAHPGGRFQMTWTFANPNGEDVQIHGIGIVVDGKLSAAYYPGYPAIAVYSVEKHNPLTLSGKWAIPPAAGIFPEQLVKVPAGHPVPSAPKKKAKPEATTQA